MVEVFKQKYPGITAETVNLRGDRNIPAHHRRGRQRQAHRQRCLAVARLPCTAWTSQATSASGKARPRTSISRQRSQLRKCATRMSQQHVRVHRQHEPGSRGQDPHRPGRTCWTRSGRAKARCYSRTLAPGRPWHRLFTITYDNFIKSTWTSSRPRSRRSSATVTLRRRKSRVASTQSSFRRP